MSLNGKKPYKLWHDEKPDMGYLMEFGSKVFILDRLLGNGKFDSRSKKANLLGYAKHSKKYKVWLPNEKRIEVSQDIQHSGVCPTNAGGSSKTNNKEFLSKAESYEIGPQVDIEPYSVTADREFKDNTTTGEDQSEEREK